MTGLFIRERRRELKQKHRGEAHIKTEADIGVMRLQAKEHGEPKETGRGKEGSDPRNLRDCVPADLILD